MNGDTQEIEFPLEDWFDLGQRISRDDIDASIEQMRFYASKDGGGRKDELRRTIAALKCVARKHNSQIFDISGK